MRVTRDVIYDLLPAYFAGEASVDTRALVEDFLATDPELGRMAARFQAAAEHSRGAVRTGADRERQTFNDARARMKLRQAAWGWTMGALLAFGIALATGVTGRRIPNPGVIIGVVFAAGAAATWIAAFFGNAERWYRALTGENE